MDLLLSEGLWVPLAKGLIKSDETSTPQGVAVLFIQVPVPETAAGLNRTAIYILLRAPTRVSEALASPRSPTACSLARRENFNFLLYGQFVQLEASGPLAGGVFTAWFAVYWQQ